MGLLKSVIADARSGRNTQRAEVHSAGVSAPIPAARSSDHMHTKNSGKQMHSSLMESKSSIAHKHQQTARLGKQQIDKIVASKPVPRQLDKAVKPAKHTSGKLQKPSIALTTSESFRGSTRLLQDQWLSNTEKKSVASDSNQVAVKTLKPPVHTQTLHQMSESQLKQHGRGSDSKNLSGTELSVLSSESNSSPAEVKFRTKAQDTEHRYSAQSNVTQQSAPENPAQPVIPQAPIIRTVEPAANTRHTTRTDTEFQAEKYIADSPSDELNRGVAKTRQHNADTQLHQQTEQLTAKKIEHQIEHQIDKGAGVPLMAAHTTLKVAEQIASQQTAYPSPVNPPEIQRISNEVRIGQVDVFIEKPAAASATTARSLRPSISMASRHYLRRL